MMLALVSVLLASMTSSWAATTPPGGVTTAPPPADLVTVLKAQGNFNTLLDLVTKAGLANTLLSASKLTLFAPTDAAFAKLPAGTLQALEGDVNQLKSILSYHAVADSLNIRRNKFQDRTVPSLEAGLPIRLNIYRNVHSVSAEGVNITTKNIPTSNGYIQELDGVMMPPAGNVVDIVANTPTLSQLKSLMTAANLINTVKDDMNITVFAPNDDAFAKVDPKILSYLGSHPNDLAEVLLYHVIGRTTLYSIGMYHTLTFPTADHGHDRIMTFVDSSENIYINDAKVVQRDISATNGVIHVIDKVLIPAKILLKIEDQGLVIG